MNWVDATKERPRKHVAVFVVTSKGNKTVAHYRLLTDRWITNEYRPYDEKIVKWKYADAEMDSGK